ncbi:hypothetical protein N801_07530 [Knoellia aerolata DSM 18566]|uniref:Uncharacterized protein n=1 Tax=Knoellia aerolata DSM 18566 TaxID=1385519 RepID=A0A0A0JZ78_9MICO|nr:hypothetical protein N801_07530 [Knoellia aerolata DSM 18566]
MWHHMDALRVDVKLADQLRAQRLVVDDKGIATAVGASQNRVLDRTEARTMRYDVVDADHHWRRKPGHRICEAVEVVQVNEVEVCTFPRAPACAGAGAVSHRTRPHPAQALDVSRDIRQVSYHRDHTVRTSAGCVRPVNDLNDDGLPRPGGCFRPIELFLAREWPVPEKLHHA